MASLQSTHFRCNSCCCTCWMRTCRACCISSYDTSPSLRSSCLCLELKMKHKTHATTRIAFVSLPHLSTWNTFSPGIAVMRTGLAASSAITEHKTADGSNKSTSSLHLSTRNFGPCNQTFEKISSSDVTPRVSSSAGFSTPEQWNHLTEKSKSVFPQHDWQQMPSTDWDPPWSMKEPPLSQTNNKIEGSFRV